ncbi:MAG: carboxylesterase family protein, partial [Gammaproteobacteria bacterium]|nr:carboxylesterase family protein [Gammaproteobacteria bacterium]
RWRPPQKVAPWERVRAADKFGHRCMQHVSGAPSESEDCLYLNVWTPGVDDGKRPVMVWIHGGGNTVGAGSQPRINGEHLARMGDVVAVTLNYRLGVIGFLHAPELGATGNEALLDQVAALRWVRAEIAAFGGDPDNVTVFGQSAGGFDIAQLMAMPAAEGCFDKAVPMSGSLTRQVSAQAAHATATALAEEFGGFDKLRSVSANDLHGIQSSLPGARWAPTCDGSVIAEDAAEALSAGRFTKDMPLMIGHARDESTLFTIFNEELARLNRARLVELAAEPFGDNAADAVACYEEDRKASGLRIEPLDVWAAMMTDRMFRIPAIRTAECHLQHTPLVWMYRFDYESPARDGRLQACHSLDIPFVWGTYGLPQMERFCGTGETVTKLSHRVMASYLAFARTGNPNNETMPVWPTYDTSNRATLLFDEQVHVLDAPLDAIRQMWGNSVPTY